MKELVFLLLLLLASTPGVGLGPSRLVFLLRHQRPMRNSAPARRFCRVEGRGLGDILSKMLIPVCWCRDFSGLQSPDRFRSSLANLGGGEVSLRRHVKQLPRLGAGGRAVLEVKGGNPPPLAPPSTPAPRGVTAQGPGSRDLASNVGTSA